MAENCVQCGKKRKIPPKSKRYVSTEVYKADPYCSRKCCEQAHGIVHRSGHTSVYYEESAA